METQRNVPSTFARSDAYLGSTMTKYGERWEKIREIRLWLDENDEGEPECQFCGRTEQHPDVTTLHVHHQVPVSWFEDSEEAHTVSNTMTVCPRCHGKVHAGKSPPKGNNIPDVDMY